MIARLVSATLVTAWLAAAAPAQLATSTNYQWLDLSFDAAGGASSSETTVAFWTLDAWSGEASSSTNFQISPGLHGSQEVAPGTGPLVFAVVPPIGDRLGGEPVTIHGMNFLAGTSVDIGTAPVTGATIVSGSIITATTGAPFFGIDGYGPQDVVVGNVAGSSVLNDGFISEPAVIAAQDAFQGASWTLDAYGEPGQTFQTWISPTTLAPLVAPTDYGQVQIGPHIVVLLFLTTPYGTDGHVRFEFPIPIDPILMGFTVYIQNLHFGDLPPGELTNQTQTTFH